MGDMSAASLTSVDLAHSFQLPTSEEEIRIDTTEAFKHHFDKKNFDSWDDFEMTLKAFEEETSSGELTKYEGNSSNFK